MRHSAAQVKPYWNEIQAFKQQDSVKFPQKHAVLFVGSSSFRLWGNMKAWFPSTVVINRGFGGAEITDVITYADDIIFPYKPSQLVIYCGENDIAETGSGTVVYERTKELVQLIREKMPRVNIVYVSIKPSPSRKKFFAEVTKANELIKNYLAGLPRTTFIDIYPLMLGANGKPLPHIFKEDSLHMNEQGYVIWQKAIGPHLK
jgi:lysophospholipase L1-like esterase